MNLIARYELNMFIKYDLENLIQSISYKPGTEVFLKDQHIWEKKTWINTSKGNREPVAYKVMNLHEISNIEYGTDFIFITQKDGSIIMIYSDGAYEADRITYLSLIASGSVSLF